MDFDAILDHAIALLQRRRRLTYGALKRQFQLDDAYLADLTAELIDGQRVAVDEGGKVLVWTGPRKERSADSEEQMTKAAAARSTPTAPAAEAERRQLTVMFCDVVDSTALSQRLDPEELREVTQQYQQTCTAVIRRYAGYVAQHLGDGLLVYFGYPVAHEDEAARAVRASLEIIAALRASPLQHRQLPSPLQVRIGIHTGLVVIGEIGSSEKREMLALGETPNIAARVQGVAEPDTVVMSTITQRLVQGLFECQDLGPQMLKGIATPLSLYRVIRESAAQSRFEVAVGAGLTPLVGREEELGLLQRRWAQAQGGEGQVVLLSGEPGIGKSRLVQELKEQLSQEGTIRIEFRCSPYHQNSALYPVIEHLQRVLGVEREDSAQIKVGKLAQTLSYYRFPQADTLPLLAALLSLPHPDGIPSLTLSPEQQKEKTLKVLVRWLCEEAERQAVYCAWEDLHWADPSTLELLALYLDQVPTARMLALLTFRPEFMPPWGSRSYLSQLTLGRLGRSEVERIVANVTGGRTLPDAVVEQVVAKTDGVPLFVEELTKTVIESGLVRAVNSHYELTRPVSALAIPATLHDSLMARLDRLAEAKGVAQWGATLGREFSYELLQAISSVDEATLQHRLARLVDAELVYQRGLPPHAHYIFKHALVQETAYQSLLKRERQRLHQQIAHVLVECFLDISATQPELVGHHYTEAGLIEQAIPYWQQAGERASQRSAHVEALAHLTKGLELLKNLPDTPERDQQELALQIALGDALIPIKTYTAPEVEKTYTLALELCRKLGEVPQLFSVLFRLGVLALNRGELQTTREVSKQLMVLAQNTQDEYLLAVAHMALGCTLAALGELISARPLMEQAITLYDPQQHPRPTVNTADPRIDCLCYLSWTLLSLGYPEQGSKCSQEAVTLAKELSHPFSLAYALGNVATVHHLCREEQLAQARAEELIALSAEQGFPYWLARGMGVRGAALAAQGRVEEGISQLQQSLLAFQGMGVEMMRVSQLPFLAAAYARAGQTKEGLRVTDEALALVNKTGARVGEAGLYVLKGWLFLARSKDNRDDAEACFLRALEIARRQQAKLPELHATMSLARLWQQQGKQHEAHKLLSDVYHWFTEGFDTKDLQEAKALLDELAEAC